MGKVITLFIIAGMMLGMPEIMQTLTATMGTEVTANSGSLGQVTNNIQASFQGITNLISAMSYIAGIGFALKGVLALKEYAEYGDYQSNQTSEVAAPIVKKTEEKKTEPISLKKEEVTTVIKPVEKEQFKFNLDFENKTLNNKLGNIEKLINTIVSLPVLEQDVENKVLLSSTQEKYVKQIHKAYISIPQELRDRDIKGSTATQLALEQLILVENGLLEMETELLKQQVSDLNIMSRFLKEKFPEHEILPEKKYLTVGQ